MYTAFYGLREKPFALLPDPRYLFLAESHREALAHLLYGIDQGEGFIAVTGEVGTGKTTLCRTLLERLGSETEVAFLFNPSRSGVELLQDISAEFGLDSARRSRSELGIELNRFLLRKKQEGRRVLLIIDEAQNLSHDTLEQVRLLSNLETSSSKLIQILLLGQPELDQKLDSSQLRQLRQRISVRWGLRPLAAKETHEYVRHRLRVAAGTDRSIFNDGALREIHRRSHGVPRIVNVLCDRALLAGYVARASTVGPALVKKAAREIPDVQRGALFARSRSSRSKFFGIGAALTLAFATGWFFAAGGPAWDRAGELWPSAFPGASSTSNAAWERDVSSAPPFEPLPLESADESVELLPLQSDRQPIDQTTDHKIGPDVSDASTGLERALAAAPVRRSSEVVAAAPAASDATAPDATAPDAVATAAVATAATAPIAMPPEVSMRALQPSAVAGDGALAPGRFLAAVVANEEPAATRLEALNAVLGSFGRAGFEASPSGDASMLAGLRQRGLAVLVFEKASTAALRLLNHPALIQVSGDDHRTRILALMKLDGDRAYLYGLSGGGPLRVPLGELEQQWRGGAWVVWNDFEDVRPVLALGEKGTAVEWLQKSLAELGYYEGEASGLFDRSTSNGLRAFQQVWRLQVDGMAGPRTRMVLYDLLDDYPVPRLVERDARFEAAGEGAG